MSVEKVYKKTLENGRERKYALSVVSKGLEVEFLVPGSLGWSSIWRATPSVGKSDADKGAKKEPKVDEEADTMSKVRRTIVAFCSSPKMVDGPPDSCEESEMSIWTLSDEEASVLFQDMVDAMGWKGEIFEQAQEVLSDPEFRSGS